MLVCCSEIENKMMPADDAVSPYARRPIPDRLHPPNGCGPPRPGCGEAAASGRHGVFGPAGTNISTFRAFNLIQLIFYILRQTGPAHLLLTTYSISMDSIAAIHRKVETGELLSVRFLIDNRVRSITQTVRLSGDHVPGLLPLPRASCRRWRCCITRTEDYRSGQPERHAQPEAGTWNHPYRQRYFLILTLNAEWWIWLREQRER